MTDIEKFFKLYEEGANSFNPDLVTAQFTDVFLGADPNGVVCLRNDESFRKAIPERQAFFQQIGFSFAKLIRLVETPLDEHYTMAKVHWQMSFEKEQGKLQVFTFFITYFLFRSDAGLKVAFYISHDDEQKVMREAGLIPATPP
ncbi:hypothetical protein [Massilia glaciei]|uniref:Nuclear transport factor 2 family protein n=1 Tax=Massilia glaciei TaxID=1524097 RepID=A0A2U2HG60_9BURK|nr:hypothetical protein [Massilia glaciei]PWF43696.1 hypothetical protein C7C56_020615 [Massilia glaciei]